jgi:hypothetical protein
LRTLENTCAASLCSSLGLLVAPLSRFALIGHRSRRRSVSETSSLVQSASRDTNEGELVAPSAMEQLVTIGTKIRRNTTKTRQSSSCWLLSACIIRDSELIARTRPCRVQVLLERRRETRPTYAWPYASGCAAPARPNVAGWGDFSYSNSRTLTAHPVPFQTSAAGASTSRCPSRCQPLGRWPSGGAKCESARRGPSETGRRTVAGGCGRRP